MKRCLIICVPIIVILGFGILFFLISKPTSLVTTTVPKQKERPLEKYTYENLRHRQAISDEIKLDKLLKTGDGYNSYLFSFKTEGKKVSGLANIPELKAAEKFPVLILIRGYVDQSVFTTGEGSQRVGEAFAKNGFITLAPDFLGYGESDKASIDSMEERFQSYPTVLDLIASVPSLKQANPEKIGIWGHSNGGQITLSILEITGKEYPTVIWAPVSKPFPYSILYYTDEFEDKGKTLRKVLANFEKDYDVEKYNPTNFFDWIKAPIQLHQGGNDEEVPQLWSDNLYKTLKEKGVEIEYFTYPGENHNFNMGNWNTAFTRSLEFFRIHFAFPYF
jgi:hypothetical protein